MQQTHTHSLFIYTALECEAKALIRKFELKKDSSVHPFAIYRNDVMLLCVTGIGKVAMAAGVAYSQALYAKVSNPIMLNIGIAGHKNLQIGELRVASKVIDADSSRVFYPQLIGQSWPESSSVRSTTVANTNYTAEVLNDMEASAFYETAVKFSSCELIHCLKVVSDNESSAVEQITPKRVEQWMAVHQQQLNEIFQFLHTQRQLIIPDALQEYEEILSRWHFSVSGQVKLQGLLRRWKVLSGDNWLEKQSVDFASGKQLLRCLQQDIAELKINL